MIELIFVLETSRSVMVRVIIKGGVWKNTEDEVLKAAIMKYGKNQWSRIASLLHRKSAKQCKARWFEWLDPRIKKTEWSREEDEKLLNLAKIMPTQWRTIAPIVGRTAAQCLERYEQLLDEAQRRAEGIEDEDTMKEAKKLRPGDVDPTPETKPARPDPVDMDEDELEMLSEARARLANTQGKKAKRKAREKQLAEARRLASLQKRRELRAAGIVTNNNLYRFRKNKEIDYNAEIPFERPVPAGFHDPSEDKFEKPELTKIEEKRRDQKEFEERQKDKEKLKKRRAEDNPESIFAKKHEKKRSRLVLPEPQVSDMDLENIVKMGQMTDSVRSMVDENPTSTLLHEFTEVNVATAARTARTPADTLDTVAMAADDLLALTTAETPLKGGLNTPLHSTEFSTTVDRSKNVPATPNTILPSPQQQRTYCDVSGNSENYLETPGSQRHGGSSEEHGHRMTSLLSQLPKPRNEFEVILPEDEQDETLESEEWVEDAAELKERRSKLEQLRQEKERRLRTQVFQRALPIPSKVNYDYDKKSKANTDLTRADDMIKTEMVKLMEWDVAGKVPDDLYTPDEMAEARKLIEDEMEKPPPLDANMWTVLRECSSELICYDGRYVRITNLGPKQQIEALNNKFSKRYDWMTDLSKKTQKLEKKLKIKLGGYITIQNNLQTKLQECVKQREKLLTELKTFQRLEQNEERAMVKRVDVLMKELREVQECQDQLQKQYAELQREHCATMQINNH
ncbi:hypothetical protein M3Y95_00725000 [Aphelenchoides besseyi]|nr:hypothetical protein M3Y95_00725000 [Aphelenchoides besseyi]